MNIKSNLMVVCFFMAGLFSVSVYAEDDGHHEMTDSGGHHDYPSHVVGLFLGGTDQDGRNTVATFGVEYEYHFHKYVGVGAILERSPEAHGGDGVSVGLLAVHLHPYGGLRITGGFGIDRIDGHEDEQLYRVGAAYDFEVGHSVTVAPTVNVDFVDDHENIVFGVVVARHF